MYVKYIMWAAAALFYFYEFVLRVMPSVMVKPLMQVFDLSALSLGTMSATYFYSYGLLQIPVGIIADRYGVRLSMTIGCLICALSLAGFSFSLSIEALYFSRFMMGAGSAFAYVSILYLIRQYFKKKQFGLMAGLTNAVGVLGAICAERPMVWLMKIFDWRHALMLVAIMGVLIAVLIATLVKEPVSNQNQPATRVSMQELLGYLSENTWLIVLATVVGLMHFGLVAFGAMWGVSFIQEAYDLSLAVASERVSLFYVGAIAGGSILGYVSDRASRLGTLLGASICGAISSFYLLNSWMLSLNAISGIMFMIGFCSSSFGIGYAYAFEKVEYKFAGSVAGFMNTVLILFSAVSMPLIGFLLDIGRKGGVYTLSDYDFALLPIPVSFVLAAVLVSILYLMQKRRNM